MEKGVTGSTRELRCRENVRRNPPLDELIRRVADSDSVEFSVVPG